MTTEQPGPTTHQSTELEARPEKQETVDPIPVLPPLTASKWDPLPHLRKNSKLYLIALESIIIVALYGFFGNFLWIFVAIILAIFIPSLMIFGVALLFKNFRTLSDLQRNVVVLSAVTYFGLALSLLFTSSVFDNDWATVLVGFVPLLILVLLVLPDRFSKIRAKFGGFEVELETPVPSHELRIDSFVLYRIRSRQFTKRLDEYVESLRKWYGSDPKTLVIELVNSEDVPFSLSELLEKLREVFPKLQSIVFIDRRGKRIAEISLTEYLNRYPATHPSILLGLAREQFDTIAIKFERHDYRQERPGYSGLRNIVGQVREYGRGDNYQSMQNALEELTFAQGADIDIVDISSFLPSPERSIKMNRVNLLREMLEQDLDHVVLVDEDGRYQQTVYRDDLSVMAAKQALGITTFN